MCVHAASVSKLRVCAHAISLHPTLWQIDSEAREKGLEGKRGKGVWE
jgi:hypothetical protein